MRMGSFRSFYQCRTEGNTRGELLARFAPHYPLSPERRKCDGSGVKRVINALGQTAINPLDLHEFLDTCRFHAGQTAESL
jgi:hypothetical protein